MGRRLLSVDKRVDNEINNMLRTFRAQGYYNITKGDVVKYAVEDFKRRDVRVYRPPKTREFRLI